MENLYQLVLLQFINSWEKVPTKCDLLLFDEDKCTKKTDCFPCFKRFYFGEVLSKPSTLMVQMAILMLFFTFRESLVLYLHLIKYLHYLIPINLADNILILFQFYYRHVFIDLPSKDFRQFIHNWDFYCLVFCLNEGIEVMIKIVELAH